MAEVPHSPTGRNIDDNQSDYGSDLDEAALEDILSQQGDRRVDALFTVIPNGFDEPVIPYESTELSSAVCLPKLPHTVFENSLDENRNTVAVRAYTGPIREPSVEVEYDEQNRRSFSAHPQNEEVRLYERSASAVPEDGSDFRSPLERFRLRPKKPLSVTDLVSPSWCELQYWYNLTRYGRVRRTTAMKQGSRVHKTLEEQVHTRVPIDVVSREDAFGLKIWNVIQGLRTLRATGMTRELEVWGIVEGEIVNGIIDEVNSQCPDKESEATILDELHQNKPSGHPIHRENSKASSKDANQQTLADYFTRSQGAKSLESSGQSWLGPLHERPRKFYFVDVKTRKSQSLPSSSSQLRPTAMQLMLYHRLFMKLASNTIASSKIFSRYNLMADEVFSDPFIAQILGLDGEFQPDTSQDDDHTSTTPSQKTVHEIIEYNTLAKLWSLLMLEFQMTVPDPLTSLSPMLTAEFRTSGSGSFIGKRSFVYNSEQLDTYLKDEMRWWRGERETKGVEIEEAFKCGICEFANDCTWRAEKIEKAVEEAKLKMELRKSRKRSDI